MLGQSPEPHRALCLGGRLHDSFSPRNAWRQERGASVAPLLLSGRRRIRLPRYLAAGRVEFRGRGIEADPGVILPAGPLEGQGDLCQGSALAVVLRPRTLVAGDARTGNQRRRARAKSGVWRPSRREYRRHACGQAAGPQGCGSTQANVAPVETRGCAAHSGPQGTKAAPGDLGRARGPEPRTYLAVPKRRATLATSAGSKRRVRSGTLEREGGRPAAWEGGISGSRGGCGDQVRAPGAWHIRARGGSQLRR